MTFLFRHAPGHSTVLVTKFYPRWFQWQFDRHDYGWTAGLTILGIDIGISTGRLLP